MEQGQSEKLRESSRSSMAIPPRSSPETMVQEPEHNSSRQEPSTMSTRQQPLPPVARALLPAGTHGRDCKSQPRKGKPMVSHKIEARRPLNPKSKHNLKPPQPTPSKPMKTAISGPLRARISKEIREQTRKISRKDEHRGEEQRERRGMRLNKWGGRE